jgi:hypothetical protein
MKKKRDYYPTQFVGSSKQVLAPSAAEAKYFLSTQFTKGGRERRGKGKEKEERKGRRKRESRRKRARYCSSKSSSGTASNHHITFDNFRFCQRIYTCEKENKK